MAIRKIIKFPAPSLRNKCADVDLRPDWFFKTDFIAHLDDLEDTLEATPNGVALASNQIRAEGWRVFVVKPGLTILPNVVINPMFLPDAETVGPHSQHATVKIDEGCLSVPELWAKVPRYDRVIVSFFNERGEQKELTVDGISAQVVQHECQHLDGGLIYDLVPKRLQIETLQRSIRNRRAGR
jgi:peptide deformylase